MMDSKDSKDRNFAEDKAVLNGYNQTYIILSKKPDTNGLKVEANEVLFRCGNWCYKGLVQFAELKLNTEEIPLIIPALQKQQGSLRYFCTSKR